MPRHSQIAFFFFFCRTKSQQWRPNLRIPSRKVSRWFLRRLFFPFNLLNLITSRYTQSTYMNANYGFQIWWFLFSGSRFESLIVFFFLLFLLILVAVVVHLRATGGAPILKQSKFKVASLSLNHHSFLCEWPS